MPLTDTDTPLSVVESGTVPEEAMFEARFVPKIETSDPGATACPVDAPAVLVTPPALTTGGGVWAEAAIAVNSNRETGTNRIEQVFFSTLSF